MDRSLAEGSKRRDGEDCDLDLFIPEERRDDHSHENFSFAGDESYTRNQSVLSRRSAHVSPFYFLADFAKLTKRNLNALAADKYLEIIATLSRTSIARCRCI